MIECIMIAGIAMWSLEADANVTLGSARLLIPIQTSGVEFKYKDEDTVVYFYFDSRYRKAIVENEHVDIDAILRKCRRI